MKHEPVLYLVVPCFNEQEVLNESANILKNKLNDLKKENKISMNSRILFVDDGSKDDTWKMISKLHKQNSLFSGLKLSRNYGQQKAILAGLDYARSHCDISISLDADLQDDPEAIDEMLSEFSRGNDVVYGIRNDRRLDSLFKRSSASAFYTLTKKLGAKGPENAADFRLMSKRAMDGLFEFEEGILYLRGIVPMIGYPSSQVEYARKERLAGVSKYPFSKMITLAIDGITSLSIKPLRLIFFCGILTFCLSVLLFILYLMKLAGVFYNLEISFLLVSLWFLSSLILIALGIIGEYLGKAYIEIKHRPRYFIKSILDLHETEQPDSDITQVKEKRNKHADSYSK